MKEFSYVSLKRGILLVYIVKICFLWGIWILLSSPLYISLLENESLVFRFFLKNISFKERLNNQWKFNKNNSKTPNLGCSDSIDHRMSRCAHDPLKEPKIQPQNSLFRVAFLQLSFSGIISSACLSSLEAAPAAQLLKAPLLLPHSSFS